MAIDGQLQVGLEQDNVDDSVLQQLVSADQGELLNIIDKLRGFGISGELALPLPQIIVCGDQSSGKSSVLEAISGRPFPKGDSVCTTFATELALRRSASSGVSVCIKPAATRSASEHERLANFAPPATENFESTIKKAKEFLRSQGRTGDDSYFEDVLHVEVMHPNLPPLTLVDLPGIIHVPNKRQVEKDVDVVHNLAMSYMENENSIILAVISAQNDLENQEILRMVKRVDPEGERTLGVITKPDTLLPGSWRESLFVRCAKNEEHRLDLGWHVVKNRSQEVQDSSNLSLRKKEEDDFFFRGIWKQSLKPWQLGINALRTRLSSLLEQRTRPVLPSILSSIKISLSECEDELAKLKEPRTTPAEQRKYLTEISQAFQNIIRQAVNGSYTDTSFFSPPTSVVDPVYLRAAISNLNDGFASIMRQQGHSREFIDSDLEESEDEDLAENLDETPNPKTTHFVIDQPEKKSIQEYVYEIEELSNRTRGAEQPGLPNHRVIAHLFRNQSERWESIAAQHIDKVWQISQETFERIASHVASEETASMLRRHLIAQEMEKKHSQAMQTLKMLLRPYKRDIIITLDESFIALVGNLRVGTHKARDSPSAGGTDPTSSVTEQQAEGIQSELHASRFLLDYMLAYYKVALRTFIDNVANFAIEQYFIDGMTEILTPTRIAEMSDAQLEELAAESESTIEYRRHKMKQRRELQDALNMCRMASYRASHDTRTNRSISGHTTASAHDSPRPSSNQTSQRARKGIPASTSQESSGTVHTSDSTTASAEPTSIPQIPPESTTSASTSSVKTATLTRHGKVVVKLPFPGSALSTENRSPSSAAKLASSPKPAHAAPEKPKAASSPKFSAGLLQFASPPTTSISPFTSGAISQTRFSSEESQNGLGASTTGSIFGGFNSASTGSASIFGSTQANQKAQGPSSPWAGPFPPSETSTASGFSGFGGLGTTSNSTMSTSIGLFGSVQNSQPGHNSTTSETLFGSSTTSRPLFGSLTSTSASIGQFSSSQSEQRGQTSTASGSAVGTSTLG